MKLSQLTEIQTSRDMIEVFGGYNHNLRISDSEFYDMKNLSSENYPTLSPRRKRGIQLTASDYTESHSVTTTGSLTITLSTLTFLSKVGLSVNTYTFEYNGTNWQLGDSVVTLSEYGIVTSGTAATDDEIKVTISINTNPTYSNNGLIAKDALCYVNGTTLYINNYPIVGLVLTDTPKQLISMGAYIIIMPDKKYINTLDYSDKGSIEATYTSTSTVTYELCNVDGETYTISSASSTEPANPSNMDLWIDTSQSPHVLKQYSSSSKMWVEIPTTYIKIKSANIGGYFKQYDGVKITGLDTTNYTQLKDLEGQISPLWEVKHSDDSSSEDYIVVIGILDSVGSQTSPITVSRTMPNLDFIIESENRLWGCRYGLDVNNNIVNEIYACKLGDFKNWNCFMGLSTDSYTASCGTDGQFTGAIQHMGYPLFFKERYLHKVYGNYPSNYQIQSTACRGVQKGAGNSLAIVNETLFYKSRNGVCAYDGSLPAEVSDAFGDVHYTGLDTTATDLLRNGAVAGSLNNKYYISMKSEVDNLYYLFVYDALNGMWHKEDNIRADCFCPCRGDLYFIDHADKRIKSILGTGTIETGVIEWMAETGIIGMSMPDNKYISRILLRMALEIGSRIIIYTQYDSCGEWEHIATLTGTNVRSFSVPIKPKRCDHFKLRFVGTGDAKIFSYSKTIEQGSDIQ